jgi:hypothetical protein
MTVEEIKSKLSLKAEFERRGIKMMSAGNGLFKCKCPFHEEKTPSCHINEGKGLFQCFGCKVAGSIIDVVMKLDGLDFKGAVAKLGGETGFSEKKPEPQPNKRIEKIYHYTDENGDELFQVIRFDPKDFRQRHQVDGEWVWSMDGVRRVLYRLVEVIKSKVVWIVEGEKDADTLSQLGIVATCNVGGAGKWLDGYTDSLADKEIVLCGDNDKPGQDHVRLVSESISGKVSNTRTISPPKGFKDVSDWVYSFKDDLDSAKNALNAAVQCANSLIKGVNVPIFSMLELEAEYARSVTNTETTQLRLSTWLPSLTEVRPLIPGELVTFIADTGTGKTAVLQNLAIHARPIKTLMFEMELPNPILFERFICAAGCLPGPMVENEYREGQTWRPGIDQFLNHIYVCPSTGINCDEIERVIVNAELKLGERPRLILLDYVQLIQGYGHSRYERMSDVAEGLKIMAKKTQTIIVIASQISRPKEGDEITLHSAKDSGSIENSSGLVVGLWKTSTFGVLRMKILKNTKGNPGREIDCNFDGPTMRITERTNQQPPED